MIRKGDVYDTSKQSFLDFSMYQENQLGQNWRSGYGEAPMPISGPIHQMNKHTPGFSVGLIALVVK